MVFKFDIRFFYLVFVLSFLCNVWWILVCFLFVNVWYLLFDIMKKFFVCLLIVVICVVWICNKCVWNILVIFVNRFGIFIVWILIKLWFLWVCGLSIIFGLILKFLKCCEWFFLMWIFFFGLLIVSFNVCLMFCVWLFVIGLLLIFKIIKLKII